MKKTNNLRFLLSPWIPNAPTCFFNNIQLDSRQVIKGDLFVAILGHFKDGRNFISEAISNGAIAVIAESTGKYPHGQISSICGIPIIYLLELNKKLSTLAKIFYKHPGKNQTIIGVTGTNGKTTITQLLAQWVKLLGKNSAIIGTMGYGLLENLQKTKNTTESAIDMQRILHILDNNNINTTAIEISSHALVQHRVADITFSAGVFTNLSHDHLDYHNEMDIYESAKWSFFSKHIVNQIIINADDAIGFKWLTKLPNAVSVSLDQKNYEINLNRRWLKATRLDFFRLGVNIYFNSSWGCGKITSNLIGDFNISNLLLALTTLLTLNYSLSSLLDVSSKLRPVSGRMELFVKKGKPKIIVDYAHTPAALKQALITARQYCKGKLWCIFGCGGERDRNKRPIMASIAEKLADIVIITEDNPRNESQTEINNNILSGFTDLNFVHVIDKRTKAINKSIKEAQLNDLILIAGKGHEDYQIIGNNYIPYSDCAIVKSLLEI
ncbi:UDP-N-acetylmuramoyl-L-alanyl-D-glutamate--2,6-diaminopimelate ligase [Candidatus Pantoea edessiphila]|uniref:UDP-N-acetylmuramoyl-L-alanyl-D-glutamate--2,6-diaminopimelate ligase n=1 Tax=Candidatus Pantoea edessiphila TaxID=2044610 RepID=A0A2P5T248_9GAMM|nr:UDP-N-acetylmuramoyl-L-alanyl-D-glutamate--2,6-diaminopimelate ligase [Candidatus Pantoea edessiphila]PPI88648.1 UDP-N-acetylmuramoyl-L-alanyl-D-glutamate--2,6-diaminopimelate ligase [Candidatus Pantoea edessiphila]